VFKFLFIEYNKNCHPGDVRCSSAVNKVWSECSDWTVFIREFEEGYGWIVQKIFYYRTIIRSSNCSFILK